jgi:hypothetical protein
VAFALVRQNAGMSDREPFSEAVFYRLPSGKRAGPVLVVVDIDDDGEEWLRSVEFNETEQWKHAPSYSYLLYAAIAIHLHKQQDYERSYPPGGRRHSMTDVGLPSDAEVNEVRMRRRNNRMTPELLREVERIYIEGGEHGAQEVAEQKGVSRRTADRYVQEAKRARNEGRLG